MPLPTDKELLDFLQAENSFSLYTGKCVFRWSERGWRLHETSRPEGHTDVRAAIAAAMEEADDRRKELRAR